MTLTKNNDVSDIIIQIAVILRLVREQIKIVGLDKAITDIAESIPDTYGRLEHIIHLTAQAADRSLTSAEAIQPQMEWIGKVSVNLTKRWDEWAVNLSLPKPALQERLILDTHDFLKCVPEQTLFTHAHLVQIMMAQDFHDITGQMLMRMRDILHDMEHQLLALLLINSSEALSTKDGLKEDTLSLNKSTLDNTATQEQVDNLLDSLGF